MNTTDPRKPARYVEPNVDEARVNRMWAAVRVRAREGRSSWSWASWRVALGSSRVALPAALTVVAAIAGFAWLRRPAPAPAVAGTVLEVSKDGESVTLADGSRVTLRAPARVRWNRLDPAAVELTVDQGDVELAIVHDAARSFVVHAGDFDVEDTGTRFSVSIEGAAVHVAVTDGSVSVRRRAAKDALIRLAAGESWASAKAAATEPDQPDPRAPGSGSGSPPASPSGPGSASPSASEATAGEAGMPSVVTPAAAPREPGAKELLASGEKANLEGRPRDAAAAFDALRRRFRSDRRAGLAAFELARLRQDSFGDLAGAVEALDDAIDLAPDAGFREDAEARRVAALDQLRSPRCAGARATYLSRYPEGLHARAVALRCP